MTLLPMPNGTPSMFKQVLELTSSIIKDILENDINDAQQAVDCYQWAMDVLHLTTSRKDIVFAGLVSVNSCNECNIRHARMISNLVFKSTTDIAYLFNLIGILIQLNFVVFINTPLIECQGSCQHNLQVRYKVCSG